jgi:hypothetical protein
VSKLSELFRSLATRVGFAVVLAGGLTLALATTVIGNASTAIAPNLASTTSCGYGGSPCTYKYQAGMTGAQVVPASAGQAGAKGRAGLTGMPGPQKMCTQLNIKGVKGPVTDVTVNLGGAHHNGPVKINFGAVTPNNLGQASACAPASLALIKAITAHPANYYMSVDTHLHPAGAIRGQLQHLS